MDLSAILGPKLGPLWPPVWPKRVARPLPKPSGTGPKAQDVPKCVLDPSGTPLDLDFGAPGSVQEAPGLTSMLVPPGPSGRPLDLDVGARRLDFRRFLGRFSMIFGILWTHFHALHRAQPRWQARRSEALWICIFLMHRERNIHICINICAYMCMYIYVYIHTCAPSFIYAYRFIDV